MKDFIKTMVEKNTLVKVVYFSKKDHSNRMVRGRISYADDDFFHIENDLSNDVVVPRKHLVSMIPLKGRRRETNAKVNPIVSKPKKSKPKFSYSQWWKGDHVQEAEE